MLQSNPIFFIKSVPGKAIQIQHTNALAVKHKGTYDFTFRLAITCYVSRIEVDIGNNNGLLLQECIRAYTTRFAWVNIDELTCRLSAKGPKEKPFFAFWPGY